MDVVNLLDWADSILFLYLLIEVVYLLFLGSVPQSIVVKRKEDKFYKFAVLIPEKYSLPAQDYNDELFTVFQYQNWRTKIKEIDSNQYEEAIVLGPYIDIPRDLLSTINIACNEGIKVIQLHTIINDNKSYSKRRKARKEELRNGLLKSGRCGLGLSSAMDKENFVVPLSWTQEHIKSEKTNLEWLMISHHFFIKYLSEPFIVAKDFPIHFKSRPFIKAIKRLYKFISIGNMEEIERGLTHFFPSHHTLLYTQIIVCISSAFIDPMWSIKWWLMIYITFFAFSMAMPDYVMRPHKEKKFTLYRIWKSLISKRSSKKSA